MSSSDEVLAKVYGQIDRHQVKFVQCVFVQSGMTFFVEGIFSRISLEQCDVPSRGDMSLHVGNETSEHPNALSAVDFHIHNSTFYNFDLIVNAKTRRSFAFIWIYQSLFDYSGLFQHDYKGFVTFHIEHSRFVNQGYYTITSLHFCSLYISDCYFKLAAEQYCSFDGCFVHAESKCQSVWDLDQKFQFVVRLFIAKCTNVAKISECLGFEIHSTTFVWSPVSFKFLIKAELYDHNVILNKCTFIVTDQSKLYPGTTLLGFERIWSITVTDTLVDTCEVLANDHFNIMTVHPSSRKTKFTNTTVLCPTRMKANETISIIEKTRYFTCKETCQVEQYTFESGSMKIDGTSYGWPGTEVTNFTSDPVCYPCPVGAKCDNTIQSLPNYWGYKDKNNLVVMIRCPNGYCCQNENDCTEINSCQSGRVGTLCGACKDNLTESIILPNCIPFEKCYTALVLLLYFMAALSYALAILTMDFIKKKVLDLLKKIFVALKRVLKNSRKKSQTLRKLELKKMMG